MVEHCSFTRLHCPAPLFLTGKQLTWLLVNSGKAAAAKLRVRESNFLRHEGILYLVVAHYPNQNSSFPLTVDSSCRLAEERNLSVSSLTGMFLKCSEHQKTTYGRCRWTLLWSLETQGRNVFVRTFPVVGLRALPSSAKHLWRVSTLMMAAVAFKTTIKFIWLEKNRLQFLNDLWNPH